MRSLCVLFLLLCLVPQTLSAFNGKKLVRYKWLSLETPHFQLVTDLPEEDARKLLQELEDFRYFITEIVGVNISDDLAPLPFLAIENRRFYKYVGVPENISGLFSYSSDGYSAIGNVSSFRKGPVSRRRAQHTLLHEYFHFLTFLSVGGVSRDLPGWYIEGMAEYWATFRRDGESVTVGDPTNVNERIYDLYLAVATGESLTDTRNFLKQPIPDISDQSEKAKKALGKYYARAFFVTHYLQSSSSLRRSTTEYVKKVLDGVEYDIAFQQAFGITYKQLDDDIKRYIASGLMAQRVFISSEKKIEFTQVESRVAKLAKSERHLFFAKILWNSTLLDAGITSRINMVREALKHNPENADLAYYLEVLLEAQKIGQAE